MAQLKITADGFYLVSEYRCLRTAYEGRDCDNEVAESNETYSTSTTTPSRILRAVTFEYELPEGVVVTGAKVYATLGSPLNGAKVCTINGVSVGTFATVYADVAIDATASSVTVPFAFQTNAVYHNHDSSEATGISDTRRDQVSSDDAVDIWWKEYTTYYTNHQSSLSYSDVYLLIDYAEGSGTSGDEETGSEDGSGSGDNSGSDSGTSSAGETVVDKADEFGLTSRYNCNTRWIERFDANDWYDRLISQTNFTTDPTFASKDITFNYSLPLGAVVTSAKVYANVGHPLYGASLLTINGVPVASGGVRSVDVEVQVGKRSITVPFAFRTIAEAHGHSDLNGTLTEEYWGDPRADGSRDRYRWYTQAHSSTLYFKDVQLEIEYSLEARYWTLNKDTVLPGERLEVTLNETITGNTYKAQATIGEYTTEEIESDTSMRFDVPYTWLYAIPNSTTGVGAVIVREYDADGVLVGTTAKPFTLVCPDSCVPPLVASTIEPLLTVDNVTYPEVYPDRFVQSKCGARFAGTTSGVYGSQIVSAAIEGNGERRELALDGSNFVYESGLLSQSGYRDFAIVVTDSRGRSSGKRYQIYVEPYEPPMAKSFTLHRATIDGVPDEQSPYVAYEFDPVYSALDNHNKLTVALTADGVTQYHTTADYKAFLRTANGQPRTFDSATRYTVELTLTDGYGSASFYATIMPVTGTHTTVVIRPTHREKRGLIIGDYDTALDGDWTMSALALTEPEQQTNFITVPGRIKGPLDASTALTDGEPIYGSRTLSATFENSNGTRQERTERISKMVNQLNGRRFEIIHPDFPDHYLVGRVTVKTEYNDMAHCAVSLTAICEPWKYSKMETVNSWPSLLYNGGGMTVVPKITVTGNACSAWVVCLDRNVSVYLTAGTHILPELAIHPDETLSVELMDVGNSFFGSPVEDITFSYREAVL